ncbi:uncharacterized protein LOC117951619 [Etheostoma cragini]|uniref:uncharacterized protein LOC117951619 n=1 Tax=Etheostoma cragini TaxID=417921 RepID=UPI00155E1636|nr:uncharacterized protein LOC117951619 [Etheostoma cragini]
MDVETEDMEEFTYVLVSEVVEQAAANLDELKQSICRWQAGDCITSEEDKNKSSAGCVTQQKVQQHLDRFFTKRRAFSEHNRDILQDKEVTSPGTFPSMSKQNIMIHPSSWTLCQSCPYPESLAKEAKAAKMFICQVVDDHHQQSIESLRKLHTTDSASETEKPAGKSLIKKLQSALKRRFGRRMSEKQVSAQQVHAASSKQDQRSTRLELVEKEEDSVEMEMRNLPSPASSSSLPSSNQVDDDAQPESLLLVETATFFQNELRSWKSTECCDGVLMAAEDTEGKVSTPDLADSCCQVFQETSSRTSTAQTVQALPIEGQEEHEKTETVVQTTESPQNQKISEKEAEDFIESQDVWIPETGSSCRLSTTPVESGISSFCSSTTPAMSEVTNMIDSQVIEDVWIPETGSSFRLSTTPVESSLSSFCSSTTPAMFEVANMDDSQVIETFIGTLESFDFDGKAESPVSETFNKNMWTAWRKRFGLKQRKKLPTFSDFHDVEKEQDEGPAEHQMYFGVQQLFAKPLEVKPSEADNDQVMTIYSPPEISGGNRHSVFTQKENKAAADQQLVLDSSKILAIMRRFFQSLSEEQWREVSEGVYNQDVKEQLIYMCMDVLSIISDSVIKILLQSTCQMSATPGTLTLRRPLSSKRLREFFDDNFQSSLESSFSQALCEITGADTSVRILHKFTEAIVEEVIEEVTSALSVAIQGRPSLDRRPSSAPVTASCQMSKDRVAKKTLAGAIATMKSILTGRGTAVKRRIQTESGSDPDVKEVYTEKNESRWKRLFSRRQRKVASFAMDDLNGAARSASADSASMHTLEKQQLSWFTRESSMSSPSDALKIDPWPTPLELVDYMEVEDMTPEDFISSLFRFLEDDPLSDLASMQTLEKQQLSLVPQDSSTSSPSAALKTDLWSTPVELVDYMEVEDVTPEDLVSFLFQEEKTASSLSLSDDSGDEETVIQISASQCLSAKKTKAMERNGLCCFFCNIFSKRWGLEFEPQT